MIAWVETARLIAEWAGWVTVLGDDQTWLRLLIRRLDDHVA